MLTINEIPKVFLHGETLESSELNDIILLINSTIKKLNTVETNLNNHSYDVSIPITNIYCRTKKGINATTFFPETDAKRDELLELVSNCSTSLGIKYNTTFSTISLSDNVDLMNGVWTAYPQGVNELLPHEWEVSYKKLADNSIMYMFGPVLRSNYGYKGADGDGVQYIYKLFNKELTEEERILNTPQKPSLPNNDGEYIPLGWTDDPQGPTKDYPYEYVATLKRINGNWGQFEKISLWSTYTEDGTNGDFLMRVFCRYIPTTLKPIPDTPVGGTYDSPYPTNNTIAWSPVVPSGDGPIWTSTRIFKGTELATEWSTPALEADSAELDIEYSSLTEKPNINTLRTVPKTTHPSVNVWHDPSEANIDLSAMIWRAERKIKNGVYDGEWVVTRIKGVAGSFKSMVFRRFKPTILQLIPPTPSGGTYDNPIPDGNLWFDSIPSGDSKTNGPIWASTRTFYNDGTLSSWSEPKLLADSENLDIEFSPGIGEEHTQPSNPTGEPFSNREASGWYDPSSPNFDEKGPMIWRAERKVNNGQYVGSWTVTRIYGEKGEPGYRGDFVSRVFCRSFTKPDTPTGGDYDDPIPTNTDLYGVLIWSDGIPATGPGTIYTSSRKFYGDPEHEEDVWSSPTIEADSTTLDIEYSTSIILPSSNTLRTTPGGQHPSNTGVTWYDPSEINANNIPIDPTTNKPYPIIWRAERKISGTEYDGDWVITRILGEKGLEGKWGSFKSCVFKRSNSVLEDFDENDTTYDNPIPNGWSDGIPLGNEALWMAVSRFTGNGNEHTRWTVTLQTDSSDLDIEFSPGIGSGFDCPPMDLTSNNGNTIFTHPINNYGSDGITKTLDRIARENAGWYDASSLPLNLSIIWRAERKINGLQLYEGDWVITRIQGEKGEVELTEAQLQDLDAAGLQILVTPLTIILDLSDTLTGSNDDKIDDVTANIIVYDRTGTALNNNQYLIKANDGVLIYATNGPTVNGILLPLSPLNNYVQVTGDNLTSAKSIKIINLPITTTNGNSTYTYNKGYIRVILTIPVGTSTKDVKIDIPWYLNRLGERIEKLKGDIKETYLSRDVFTNDHSNKTIKQEFDAYINLSAEGTLSLYGLIQSVEGGNGYEAAFDALYLLSAVDNISTLSKSITGTNLIADNGWCKSFTTISNRKRTACSPFVYLKPGKYIFSTYINSNITSFSGINLGIKQSSTKLDPSTLLTDFANEGWTAVSYNGVLKSNAETGYVGDYYPSTSASPNYVRIYFVFIVNDSSSNETYKEGYYAFHILLNNTNFTTCIRPQLELCLDVNTELMPTAWTPGPQDFSSEIKLTAEEIISSVSGGLDFSEIRQTVDSINLSVNGSWNNYIVNPLAVDATVGGVNTSDKVLDSIYGEVYEISNTNGGDWQLRYTLDENYTDLTNETVTWFCIVKSLNNSDSGTLNFGSGYESTNSGLQHAAIHMTATGGAIKATSSLTNPSGYNYYDLSTLKVNEQDLGNGWYKCWVSVKLGSSRTIIPELDYFTSYDVGFNSMTGTWRIYYGGIVKGSGCPTAQSIVSGIDLKRTGIDINNGIIHIQADNTIIDNNVSVGSLTTTGDGCSVNIYGGVVEFFGSNGICNIRLGLDDDGCAVLKFFDKDGNFKYDLGPSGIIEAVDETESKFVPDGSLIYDSNEVILGKNTRSNAVNFAKLSTTTSLYRFVEGYTKVGNLITYKISQSSTPSSYNGKDYFSTNMSGGIPTGELAPSGYYTGKAIAVTDDNLDGLYSRKIYSSSDSGVIPSYIGTIRYKYDSSQVTAEVGYQENGVYNYVNSNKYTILDYLNGRNPATAPLPRDI